MTKVFADGNDTVIIDCANEMNEVSCYGNDVKIYFSDGTQITCHCVLDDQGDYTWSILVDRKGTADYKISDENDDGFGDVFEIDAEAVIWTLIEQ